MTLRRHAPIAAVVALAALALSSCHGCGPLADGLPDGDRCSTCHGSADNAAPPHALVKGKTTLDVEVGQHQLHLQGGFAKKRLACEDCHVVPVNVEDPGHIDDASPSHPSDPADVTFGALASQGVSPTWSHERATCTNTYCHGATLQGGKDPAPTWTFAEQPDSLKQLGVESCSGCHGAPPPPPHPPRADCAGCHPTTVSSGLDVVAGGTHLDGKLDVATACDACHGSPGNPAPPRDVEGHGDTTARGVGAHQSHLTDSSIRRALPCDSCHLVPRTANEVGHFDTPLPAELTFSALATHDGGLSPSFDGVSCANSYCHGATLHGGAATAPEWTRVDGTQAQCGSCHGAPPPAPHPASTSCGTCHPLTVLPDGGIDLDGGFHLDGQLQVSGACGVCHPVPPATGAHAAHNGDTSAPPLSGYGDTRQVGDYFDAGQPYYLFGCGNCHPLDGAQHLNGSVDVELFNTAAPPGSLKARNAAGAVYDRLTGQCTNVYCHSSGQEYPLFTPSPGWNSGTKAACDGCHGNPPNYPSGDAGSPTANVHLVLADDGYEFGHFGGLPGAWHTSYHGGAPGPSYGAGAITCQTCHFDTTDPTSTGPSGFYWLNTTGSYQLDGGALGFSCGSCHASDAGVAPTGAGGVLPLKHVNGVRDVVFDRRTTLPAGYTGGVSPAPTAPYWVVVSSGDVKNYTLTDAGYDPATKTCSNVSCHKQQTVVQWGEGPVGWATCDICHQY